MNEDIQRIDKIYKFYSDSDFSINSLEKGYFWFSESEDFNDPFEVKIRDSDIDIENLTKNELIKFIRVNKGITLKDADTGKTYTPNDLDLDKLAPDQLTQIAQELNRIMFLNIEDIQHNKFHCMVHDANSSPLDSKLMWSHYTNGFRGFVVEYNIDNLLDSLKEHDPNFIGFNLVTYLETNFTEFIKLEINKNKATNLSEYILSKHIDWSYENELRLISAKEKSFYSKSCISRIILGGKMNSDYKLRITQILNEKNMLHKLYQASINRADFSIKIEKS